MTTVALARNVRKFQLCRDYFTYIAAITDLQCYWQWFAMLYVYMTSSQVSSEISFK